MTNQRKQSPQQPGEPTTPLAGKRPYVKPAFRHERVFETMALACGKISSTQAQCKSLLKKS
jgi:hypothetical protein